MKHVTWPVLLAAVTVIAAAVIFLSLYTPRVDWSSREIELISFLSLENLPALQPDETSSVADHPDAVATGTRLFSDPRLSINGQIACSTCHRPERAFSDGLDKARAIGRSRRNTPALIGVAYSPWLYWDGRRDSLWAQALSPLEDPAEQGGNRLYYAHLFSREADLKMAYENLFGPLPDLTDPDRFPEHATPLGNNPVWQANWDGMSPQDQHEVNRIFSNIGKILGAWERTLLPEPTLFDDFAEEVQVRGESQLLSPQAQQGLRLFIGEARCLECHNGPLFTNNEFHNTGLLSYPGELPDRGRIEATAEVLADPFNCLGPYSDAVVPDCRELQFMREGDVLLGAMRTPSLRNLRGTEPYMHKGQLKTLQDVLDHYNRAEDAMIGHNESKPLGLGRKELGWLEAFLQALMLPSGVSSR